MICFAAITPHPPIIIPGIGETKDLELAHNTIFAMDRLTQGLEGSKPDTIIVISPHAPFGQDFFGINSVKNLKGNLTDFGLSDEFHFENELEIAQNIKRASSEKKISAQFFESELDHGALVPLYYLAEDVRIKLVHLSFSGLDFFTHYQYGEVIGQVLANSSKRIAVIASGDLSHRLMPGAPAGFSFKGKKFDQRLIDLLKEKKVKDILNFDIDFVSEAGECGLRSIIVLLGIIKSEKYNFELFSYEGPFGVGYMVARLI